MAFKVGDKVKVVRYTTKDGIWKPESKIGDIVEIVEIRDGKKDFLVKMVDGKTETLYHDEIIPVNIIKGLFKNKINV